MKFNNNTGGFTAQFKLDTSIDAPTVIHVLNEAAHEEPVWYPEGAELSLSHDEGQPIDPSLITMVDEDVTNRLAFKLDPSLNGKMIDIVVE